MQHLSLPQRREILDIYIRNNKNVLQTWRDLRPIYGQRDRPTQANIRLLMKKFDETFSLCDVPRVNYIRSVRSNENIAAVEDSVADDPNTSIRHRAQELGLTYSSTWNILHKDLALKAYKIKLVQKLEWHDHPRRRTFANWALDKLKADPHFYRKIIFSDEAHFWLNGYVNKQNMRYWDKEQPQQVLETPLHPEKITVWCGLHAEGVLGPYFFRNAAGANVTVNAERYRDMLDGWFFPNVATHELDDFWFQQDGATSHTAHATIDLLRGTFGDRVISRNGPVDWPPRSCDITPLDFFLWGHVKAKVYADKPATIGHLEANIIRELQAIPPEMLEKVMKNWASRMTFLKNSRGGHMSEIIFKN